MSASQQKKRRRDTERSVAVEPSKKGLSTKAKVIIAVICVIVISAVSIYFTSDFFYQHTTAVKLGDTQFSIVDFNYFYNRAYQDYYSYVMENYEDTYANYLPNNNISYKDQMYNDEQTWDEYLETNALNLMQELAFLESNAKADNYELSQEGRTTVSTNVGYAQYYASTGGYTNVDQYLAASFGKGMNLDYYRELLTRYQTAQEWAEKKAKSFEFTTEDYETYYEMFKDTYDIIEYRSYDFKVETGDDVDENTAKDEAYYTATEFMQSVGSEQDFIDLALQYASEEDKAKYEDEDATLTSAMAGNIDASEDIINWVEDAERQAGDMSIIETDDGYTLVYFVNRNDNSYKMVNARHILVRPESVLESDYEDTAAYEAAQAAADATAFAEAEAIVKEWQDQGGTEEQFAALADEKSDDTSEGGLYTDIYMGQMVAEFNDWLFDNEHQPGDYEIVKTDYGYHIIYFVSYGMRYCDYISQNDLGNQAYNEWKDENFTEQDVTKTFAFRFAK